MDLRISSLYDNNLIYSMTKSQIGKPVEKVAPVTKTEIEKPAAIYEKTEESDLKATYSINKMSKEQRANLVSQLKAEQENRQNQLVSIVSQLMTGQGNTLAKTDDIWKFLASGNFTVTPEVKAQAQKDIAEDGYWGVAQTSQRLFDFASALAGDDEKMMQKMEAAMEKGFRQATGAWGRELPEISRKTMDASRKLFKDYYESKSTQTGIDVAV
ncbi:MAG: hypothetical protein K6E47_10710 [Lachnospiraceae bacterium]|nr:hypothetical protein [Lachnospiraceae bacterium]